MISRERRSTKWS